MKVSEIIIPAKGHSNLTKSKEIVAMLKAKSKSHNPEREDTVSAAPQGTDMSKLI